MIKIIDPQIGEEEKKAVMAVLDSKYLAEGPVAREYEQKFAEYIGGKHVMRSCEYDVEPPGVPIALQILPGDEVITTPFTFIASSN